MKHVNKEHEMKEFLNKVCKRDRRIWGYLWSRRTILDKQGRPQLKTK